MPCRQCTEVRPSEIAGAPDITLSLLSSALSSLWAGAQVISTLARRFEEPRVCGVCGALFCPRRLIEPKGWGFGRSGSVAETRSALDPEEPKR